MYTRLQYITVHKKLNLTTLIFECAIFIQCIILMHCRPCRSGVAMKCEKMMGYPKGSNPLGSGSSNRGEQHPCWQGDSKGNSVLLCLGCSEGIEFPFDRKNPKKPAVSWHTTFLGKSSVLYLCSRLTPERGWLRHLLCGKIAAGRRFSAAVGQADFVTAVLPQMQDFEKIRLAGEGSKGIYKALVPPQRHALIPPRQLQPEIIQSQHLG